MNQQKHTISQDKPFLLASGQALPKLDLAVETYGVLNADRSNTILVCHGMTNNQNAAGQPANDSVKPWWDLAIGPGRMLDTDQYFIICTNVPGGSGGSTSPATLNPVTGNRYGMDFPVIQVADMANAQALVLDHFKIDCVALAIGGCMGGFQVLEFARRYPDRLARAVAISATANTSAYTIALWELMRQAIYADPSWQGGQYYEGAPPLQGIGMTAMIGSVLWLDRETLAKKFGRAPTTTDVISGGHSGFNPDFAVEQFLAQVRARATLRFDPNSLLYLTKAVDLYDLETGYESLELAVTAIRAPVLLVSYESDWRYPKDEIAILADALNAAKVPVKHAHIHSEFGHGAFQFDVKDLCAKVNAWIST